MTEGAGRSEKTQILQELQKKLTSANASLKQVRRLTGTATGCLWSWIINYNELSAGSLEKTGPAERDLPLLADGARAGQIARLRLLL